MDSVNLTMTGNLSPEYKSILTDEALQFITSLHRHFEPKRKELLQLRKQRQEQFDKGDVPRFLSETRNVRESSWTIAPIPKEMEDRRVEITGPADRKMMINALNSGANTFMADLEDSTSPTWDNVIQGQINLRDAVNRTIRVQTKDKTYQLNDKTAVLIVRPRGWHLNEKHIVIDGKEISGSLVDFGLYFFHNVKQLLQNGSRPYFYLPKMESHLEARLWDEVFRFSEAEMNVPVGTIRATVLIETITASFEMDEILYELKDHILGLNCGRWDYIFSCIKKLRNHKDFILPDRQQVTMTVPFMESYSLLTIETCHKRNAQAIGGMAAQIPIKNDQKANDEAFQKVYADKKREAMNGHDGTWVAHPALVPVAKEAFDTYMPQKNQINKRITDRTITESDLLSFPKGEITEAGLRLNLQVGIEYLEAWLMGRGAVPIHNLMEDAATAEISRSQVWQWLRSPKGVLEDGRNINQLMVSNWLEEETNKLEGSLDKEDLKNRKFGLAKTIFESMLMSEEFTEFLTLESYKFI